MKIDILYIQEGPSVHAYATSGKMVWDQYLSQEDVDQLPEVLDAIVTARAASIFDGMATKEPIVISTIRSVKGADADDAKAFVAAKVAADALVAEAIKE